MRKVTLLQKAVFRNEKEEAHLVTIPHTWNALDGQDGGNDYHRGIGTYEFALPEPTAGMRQFVEFRGANHIAEAFVNGKLVGRHEGGFSTFRFDVTDFLKPRGNTLSVTVDNTVSHVYPQRADFTFFGGLYRDVSFMEVPQAHFADQISDAIMVKLEPRFDEINKKLKSDKARLDSHEYALSGMHKAQMDISEGFSVLCYAMIAVLNHGIHNGNTDEMEDALGRLHEYLSKRKMMVE